MNARRNEGELLTGQVVDLAHGGDGVVQLHDGRRVFAPRVVRGETVAVRLPRKHGKVWRATEASVVHASGERVTPPCAIQNRCGGCAWMHMTLREQHTVKTRWLEQAIQDVQTSATEFAEPPSEPRIRAVGPALGYRRRARLAWAQAKRGGPAQVGYRADRRADVVDVASCVVLRPELDSLLAVLRRSLASLLTGQGEIHLGCSLRTDSTTEGVAAVDAVIESTRHRGVVMALQSETAQPPELYQAIKHLVDTEACIGATLQCGGATTPATWGQAWECELARDGKPWLTPLGGFSQSNAEVNDDLVRTLASWAAEWNSPAVVELFAGSGNLTVALAPHASRYAAVEVHRLAAQACARNVQSRAWGHVSVHVQDAARYLQAQSRECKDSVLVLDPPRQGALEVVTQAVTSPPARVVYVSCDPVTLRRDLKVLKQAGYAAERVWAGDMFPHTSHFEIAVQLARASGRH
jgi:23S rRNA (uracil1939-C5)-methyltransferase